MAKLDWERAKRSRPHITKGDEAERLKQDAASRWLARAEQRRDKGKSRLPGGHRRNRAANT